MEAASAAPAVQSSRAPRGRPAAVLRLMSDDRLVALAQDGSEPAFEALVRRHRSPLLAFCAHLLGSTAEAEDAVQHTFVAAYRMIALRRPLQLRPWLYRVARNRCLSMLRARHAVAPMPADLPTEHLSAQIERREELRELLAYIARLPEPQRAALVLAEGCGLRHGEIALVLGCRTEKVKALVFQARSTLLEERGARDASCQVVRSQLATEESRVLRPALVRRHVRHCEGCRAFASALRTQRKKLAAVLPALPASAVASGVAGGAVLVGAGGAGSVAFNVIAIAVVGAALQLSPALLSDAREERRARPAAAAVASPALAPTVPAEHAVGVPTAAAREPAMVREQRSRAIAPAATPERRRSSGRGHEPADHLDPGAPELVTAPSATETPSAMQPSSEPTPATAEPDVAPDETRDAGDDSGSDGGCNGSKCGSAPSEDEAPPGEGSQGIGHGHGRHGGGPPAAPGPPAGGPPGQEKKSQPPAAPEPAPATPPGPLPNGNGNGNGNGHGNGPPDAPPGKKPR